MAFSIRENTGVLIKKAARLFEQVANQNLSELGVTYSQTIFLIRLWDQDGQSQIELARSAGLKQPSVVRTLDRMERDSLVTRVRNKEDRRVFNFFLTEKSKKICQKLEQHANTMQEIATSTLSLKKVEEFNTLIENIIDNLQSAL